MSKRKPASRAERTTDSVLADACAAIDMLPVPAFVADATGHNRHVNRHYCTLTGQPESALLGMGWRDVVHPEDAARLAALAQEMEGGAADTSAPEHRLRNADGEWTWVLSRSNPLLDDAGKTCCILGTVIALQGAAEDREKNDERLRLLAAIAERTNNWVVVTSPDSVIEWVNAAFTVQTGFTAEEANGKFVHQLLRGPMAGPGSWAPLLTAVQRAKAARGRAIYRRKDGDAGWLEANIQPLRDPSGAIQHFVALASDVTERKHAEEALIAAREAAVDSSRLKSQFLANMSHEIRTPMNGILGLTSLLLDTELSAEQREQLDLVQSSGQRLLTILNDILDVSKIEAGKLTLEDIPWRPRVEVHELLRLFGAQAMEKGIALHAIVADSVPDRILGDPTRVRQVITNLVGNALKFTERGEVNVELERVGDSLRIVVRDTGIGIPKDQLSQVFDSFSQADGSTTRRFGGTGLGLTISRDLVSLMGGRIWVESADGAGSVFQVHLPLRLPAGDTADYATQPPPGWRSSPGRVKTPLPVGTQRATASPRSARVLIAEDNPVNVRLVELLLAKHRHITVAVENGALAVERVAAEPFDLVLMDVQMPVMDGLEATRRIRASGSKVPILALTAGAMEGDAERCLAAGCDAYLSKPISPATFYEAVESALALSVPKE